MSGTVTFVLDGQPVCVRAGATVAAALRIASEGTTRVAVTGAVRAPLCGMGTCQECRVEVDGQRVLACQTLCREGMRVATGTRRASLCSAMVDCART